MLGRRMHPLRAGQPFGGIVPAAAAQHFVGTAGRPLGVAPVGARKTFREPIGHPLPSVAGKIIDPKRARPFGMGSDGGDAVSVNRILVILCEARALGAWRLIAPGIFPFVCAARCPLPLRIGRQTPARPLAITVGVLPIDTDNRQTRREFRDPQSPILQAV